MGAGCQSNVIALHRVKKHVLSSRITARNYCRGIAIMMLAKCQDCQWQEWARSSHGGLWPLATVGVASLFDCCLKVLSTLLDDKRQGTLVKYVYILYFLHTVFQNRDDNRGATLSATGSKDESKAKFRAGVDPATFRSSHCNLPLYH